MRARLHAAHSITRSRPANHLQFLRSRYQLLLATNATPPQPALDSLREYLQGTKKGGSVGVHLLETSIKGLEPLFPDMLAAVNSDDSSRRSLAYNLLSLSGPAAKSLLPELEKRLSTLENDQQDRLQKAIEWIEGRGQK